MLLYPFQKESHETTNVGDFWDWGLRAGERERKQAFILFEIFNHIAVLFPLKVFQRHVIRFYLKIHNFLNQRI